MTNKPFDEWSRWYKFSELFEYYGPLDPSSKPTRTKNKISRDNSDELSRFFVLGES